MPRPLDDGFTQDYPTPHLDAMDAMNEIELDAIPAYIESLLAKIERLEAERDALKAALYKYGTHTLDPKDCPVCRIIHDIDRLQHRVRDLEGPKVETSISTLALTVRLDNCLRNAGIETVDELSQWTESQLLCEPNLGPKSMRELREALAPLGITLRKR